MNISSIGLDLIRRHEGLRLTAYPDPASGSAPWTIGYGHTAGVLPGQTITKEQADAFLREDLAWVENCVNASVRVPLQQAQFDALCSLVFNIGANAFKGSTLLRKLNAGEPAADEFLRWNRAAGKVMPGLTTRRAAEHALFAQAAQTPQDQAATAADTQASPAPNYTPQEAAMPIPALIAAVLPMLAAKIPELLTLATADTKDERKAQATQLAVDVVTQSLGARNAQEATEMVQADPAAAATARQAVRERWADISEAGGGGIEGARKADAAFAGGKQSVWKSPSFVVALGLLPLVYMVVGAVVGLFGAPFSEDVRAAIANGIVGLILGGLIGYYYGQSTTLNKREPAA